MSLTGDIEKYGTGFKRIKDWFKSYPNLTYQVNNMQDFVQITIESISKKINDTVNVPLNVPLNVSLNERQKNIIQDIIKDSSIKQIELAQQYNVSERTIKRDLQFLQEQKIIKRTGSKKSGYWEIIIKH